MLKLVKILAKSMYCKLFSCKPLYLYPLENGGVEDVHSSIDLVGYKDFWLLYKALDLSRPLIVYHYTVFGGFFHFCYLVCVCVCVCVR